MIGHGGDQDNEDKVLVEQQLRYILMDHLLRDCGNCAESYLGTIWPEQAQRGLPSMIYAWHTAVARGLPVIPASLRYPSPRAPFFYARGMRDLRM